MSDDHNRTYEVLSTIADRPNPLPQLRRKVDGFTRMDVVKALHNSFEMIGGVQRLALWGNQNPTEFYKLWAKLLPSTSINISTDGDKVIIEHAIPTTDLDRHPNAD
jgi:hypothetical protein